MNALTECQWQDIVGAHDVNILCKLQAQVSKATAPKKKQDSLVFAAVHKHFKYLWLCYNCALAIHVCLTPRLLPA